MCIFPYNSIIGAIKHSCVEVSHNHHCITNKKPVMMYEWNGLTASEGQGHHTQHNQCVY